MKAPRVGVLFLAVLSIAGPLPVAADGRAVLERLAWLAGCWERRSAVLVGEEMWMAPAGGTMLGMSRTLRQGELVEFEAVRIYAQGDTLVYAAQPSGQPPAEFRAIEIGDDYVVFSNPAHDFPQRVRYRRAGADSLIARIEGMRDGRERGVDFPMRRVRCPGPQPAAEPK